MFVFPIAQPIQQSTPLNVLACLAWHQIGCASPSLVTIEARENQLLVAFPVPVFSENIDPAMHFAIWRVPDGSPEGREGVPAGGEARLLTASVVRQDPVSFTSL